MRTKLRNDRTRLGLLEDDALPSPLQRSIPRDVTLNGSGWIAATCAAALLLVGIVGGPLVALQLVEASANARKSQTSSVLTEAVVTEVRRSGDNKSRLTIHFRYAKDAQEFENKVQLRRDDPDTRILKAGSRVTVGYLPSEPGKSWLAGYEPREQPLWPAAIPPTVGLPGALFIVLLLRRQWKLLSEGRAVMARVISKKKSRFQDSWRVTYSWNLLNGAARNAHLNRTAEPAGSGSFLPIVYDPDMPARHSAYPLLLVRLR